MTQDGTLNGGRSALCRTERLTEDGALFAGRNARRRTERSTQEGTLGGGRRARRGAERYAGARHRTQSARRSLILGRSERPGAVASLLDISGTLDALFYPKLLSQ